MSGLRECISELLLENPEARNHPELNDGPKKIIRAIFLDSMRNVKKYTKRTDIINKYLVCEAKTNYPNDAHILPCLRNDFYDFYKSINFLFSGSSNMKIAINHFLS